MTDIKNLERFIWDKNESEAILSTDGKDYRSEARPWHTILEKTFDKPKPLYYEAEGKFISFKPVGTSQPTLSANDKTLSYEGVWENASLIIELSRDHWKKLIKIDSMPKTEEKFIDYTFEVETDFNIDTTKEHINLGEFTSMEIAQAWDSAPRYDKDGNDVENKIKIEVFWERKDGKLFLTKRIPTEWLSKAVFPVYTDVDIAWGTASEFEAGDIFLAYSNPFISCCAIDTNKFVVTYCDNADGDAGKARVGTVSGTTITWGDISEFCSDIGVGLSTGVCKLDTDKFAVVYADDAQGDDGYAIVGTVATRTISWGTSVEFDTTDIEMANCCQLGTDKFAIVYCDSGDSNNWKVCACTVSTTTITAGAPVALVAGDWDYQQAGICKLDTDKFAVMVADGDEDGNAYAVTVSGTTCTVGLVNEIEDAYCLACALTQLDTNKFVAVRQVNGGIKTNVCTVESGTGTTITKNAEQDAGYDAYYSGVLGSPFGVIPIDSTHFIITFVDAGDSNKGKSVYCTVSGTTVTFGSRETFHDAATQTPAVCVLTNPAVAVCAYADDADANDKGEAIAGTYTASAGTKPKINIGDTWKQSTALSINIGDTWKTVTKAQINVGDTWKTIF